MGDSGLRTPDSFKVLGRRIRRTWWFESLTSSVLRNRFRWGRPNGAVDTMISGVSRFGIFTSAARTKSVDALVSAL